MYHATLDYEVMKFIKPVYTDISQAKAATGLVKYGFEELGLPRIIAFAMTENKASLRVMQKIGMQPIGMTDLYHNAMLMCYEKFPGQ